MTVVGLSSAQAQDYNIIAMSLFLVSRFVCTFLLSYIKAGQLLMLLATGGGSLITGTIFFDDYMGLYCLIGVSACMSLMFPTIYGIALSGVGDDAKLGAAGLVMAIGGGAALPYLQAYIIDNYNVEVSYVLPLICFVFVAVYGLRSFKKYPYKVVA